MTRRFALIIDPVAADDPRTDFADTLREVDATAPALSVGELSTQRGDGIFETIGVVDGHPQELTAHLERLAHSAVLCDLPAPHLGQWRAAIAEAAAHCPAAESAIKLILSRGVEHEPGPTAWVTAAAAPDFRTQRTEGVRVVTLDRGIETGTAARAPWLLLGAKTLSYAVNMAALREAHRRGAADAIFVSSDGFVLEAPTATIVVRRGGKFLTTPPEDGILHGTTQLSVFDFLVAEGFETAYEQLPSSALVDADAIWLVSSLRLAAPVTAVDDVPIRVDRGLTEAMNAYLSSPRD